MDIAVVDGKCPHGNSIYETRCGTCDADIADAKRIEDAFAVIFQSVNSSRRSTMDAISDAIIHEHPTLSGQFGKAVAIGFMRHATREPGWKPFDRWEMTCDIKAMSSEIVAHPMHDGRFSCQLIVGSMLTAQQYYV